MKPVVLLIAYYFPPDTAIGGARPFRFYKYLKRRGYECHVLTAGGEGIGPDVQSVPDPLKVRPKQGLAWQVERVSWKFLYRGMAAWGWSRAVSIAGREFLARKKCRDVILVSSAPPLGTHLAARRLAREFGVPWIADFRDPIYSPGGETTPLQEIFAPRMERSILGESRAVLANTDAMRNVWISQEPGLEEKIHVLWNGFDAEDEIRPEPLPARDTKIWSHVGALYGGRDIRPILHTVERLRGGGRLGHLKFLQVGVVAPECMPQDKYSWFEIREPIPAAEARRVALDSDGLMLIQPQSAVQVPGKLFEYLRLGRPILAYVVRNSPVERILQQAGVPYACVYPESPPEEFEERLASFWEQMSPQPHLPNAWFYRTFEASRQADILDGIIQSIETSGPRI